MNKSISFYKSFKNIILAIFKQLLIIIIYIFLTLFLRILFKNSLASTNIYLLTITKVLVELIILTIFILIFRKQLVPDFNDFKKNGKKYIEKYFYYWLIGLIIMIISSLIINKFVGPSTNEELNRIILIKLPFYSIIAIVVFAPIIEECMTRVYLKNAFLHPSIYYLLSGLIFGSLHLISAASIKEFFYIIPYGTLGFVFGAMYKKSNNIWTNIFFHSLHNLIAAIIIFGGIIL